MNINQYIQHPELLNRQTLYELRRFVALYPCHQAARLLLLQNLFLLHDSTFDDALRTAAFYITDRSTLFNMVEAHFYTLTKEKTAAVATVESSNTDTLIDDFLDSVSPIEESNHKPSIVDATTDYMAYIMSVDHTDEQAKEEKSSSATTSIIDSFLEHDGGKLTLSDHMQNEEKAPHDDVPIENDKDDLQESFYTESLAKVYIKQGNYSKALEIITQINLNNSVKNPYFADQKRYLEKIIAIKNKDKK